MSGRQRAGLRSWTPPAPSPFAVADDRAQRSAERGLAVGPAHDAAETEAERAAASVAIGTRGRGGAGHLSAIGASLQRQTPAATDPAAKEKAAHDKEAEKRLGELKDAALAEAVKIEPLKSLVAQGEALLATPEGKAALAYAIVNAIAFSVLAKQELPLSSWTQDLGKLHPSMSGISGKITWEGPANKPTKAGLDVTIAPKTGPMPGLSLTAGGYGGTGPAQLHGGIAYAPTSGPLRGIDLKVGSSITEGKAGQFPVGAWQAGAGYTFQSGVLKDSRVGVTASYDTQGVGSVMGGLTIPFGSGSEKKAPRRKPEERLERWADPAAGAADRSAAAREGDVAAAPPSVEAVLAEPGLALPRPLRADMEAGFGADFSRVRLHADERAAASARDVGALAYTVGPNVVFGSGQWRPGTGRGREVLAHELAHVVQQQAAPLKGGER